jgi:hypothetical protein
MQWYGSWWTEFFSRRVGAPSSFNACTSGQNEITIEYHRSFEALGHANSVIKGTGLEKRVIEWKQKYAPHTKEENVLGKG